MNAGIGKAYVCQLLRYFLCRGDAIALQAKWDGRACGYVVGMPDEKHAELNNDLFWAYAWGAITHPWVLFKKQYRVSAMAETEADRQPPPPELQASTRGNRRGGNGRQKVGPARHVADEHCRIAAVRRQRRRRVR